MTQYQILDHVYKDKCVQANKYTNLCALCICISSLILYFSVDCYWIGVFEIMNQVVGGCLTIGLSPGYCEQQSCTGKKGEDVENAYIYIHRNLDQINYISNQSTQHKSGEYILY